MKIIFLDFDGVLNSEMWYKSRFNELDRTQETGNYPYYEFDPSLINNLNQIIEKTEAKVVVSSTWRIGRSVEDLQNLLNRIGFKGEIIDTTPHFHAKGEDNEGNRIGYTIPRGCEIDWWLKERGKFQRITWSVERQNEYLEKALVKNYIILDDDSDMLYNQREHFIKTSVYWGLNEADVKTAIQILNTPITKLYY